MALSPGIASPSRLGELLVELGYVSRGDVERALGRASETGRRLGAVLADLGFLSESELVAVLGQQLGIATCDPVSIVVPPEVLAFVPREIAERLRAIPIGFRATELGEVLCVATSDPLQAGLVDELVRLTHEHVELWLAGETELDLALLRHYGPRRSGRTSIPAPARPEPDAPVLTPPGAPPLSAALGADPFREASVIDLDDIEAGQLEATFEPRFEPIDASAEWPRLEPVEELEPAPVELDASMRRRGPSAIADPLASPLPPYIERAAAIDALPAPALDPVADPPALGGALAAALETLPEAGLELVDTGDLPVAAEVPALTPSHTLSPSLALDIEVADPVELDPELASIAEPLDIGAVAAAFGDVEPVDASPSTSAWTRPRRTSSLPPPGDPARGPWAPGTPLPAPRFDARSLSVDPLRVSSWLPAAPEARAPRGDDGVAPEARAPGPIAAAAQAATALAAHTTFTAPPPGAPRGAAVQAPPVPRAVSAPWSIPIPSGPWTAVAAEGTSSSDVPLRPSQPPSISRVATGRAILERLADGGALDPSVERWALRCVLALLLPRLGDAELEQAIRRVGPPPGG